MRKGGNIRVPRRAIVGIGMLLLVACSLPYMKDRGRDGADVFTLTVGYGLGAKARAGPVTAAALFNRDLAPSRSRREWGLCGEGSG